VHKLKSHKTVEQIAKKHRLEVSFIKNQLGMGIPIEYEHTKDKDLATDIALQHLDEIPDYYTRLKKMESDAKKDHKKFNDVKEATDGIKAKDYNGRLDRWFDDGGWVQTGGKYDGKPCAKQPGQTTKPFCRDPDDRANMSKKERNKRSAKKRREDPNPNRSGAAKIVTQEEYIQEKKGEKDACYHKVKSRYKIWPSAYASGALVRCRKVGADNWGTKSEAMEMIRFCPKCKKDETRGECKYGPKYWDMYSLPSLFGKDYDPNTPHPGNFPESKQYDHEHSMARSELSTIISAARRLRGKLKGEGNIEAWVQSKITKAADYLDAAADYIDSGEHDVVEESKKCWTGYKKTGTQKLFGKTYNRCVKKEELSNWRADLGLFEDWQKVNRQDKTDGLSQAAVNAYRRENPGSKLQTAVTEKKPKGKRAKRRKNFCSRSAGQRDMHNIDCSKTPDKPICKARRRWKC
jgi:hypothetical protein